MFNPVTIQLTNNSDFNQELAPVSLGVPLPMGVVFDLSRLTLHNHSGDDTEFHITPLSHWSDGSLKWGLLDFQADVKGNTKSSWALGVTTTETVSSSGKKIKIEIDDSGEQVLVVNTGCNVFCINKKELRLFDQVTIDGENQLLPSGSGIQLLDSSGNDCMSKILKVDIGDENNPLRRQLIIKGSFLGNQGENLADYCLTLTFYAGKPTVKCIFSLLNPRAAVHPGGVWDLGDKNSFFFKGLNVQLKLANNDLNISSSLKVTADSEWKMADSGKFQVYQNSSGGKNWNSENHVNYKGVVPLDFKGYRYYEQGIPVASGDRATPTVNMESEQIAISAHIENFWQNFPKAIEVNRNTLELRLFPEQFLDNYELQGGEQKTHIFYLDFSKNKFAIETYSNPLKVNIPVETYVESKVIPWLSSPHSNRKIQELINRGIHGRNNFFEKRETIDEYGWRNYGDIYADHEEHEYKGSSPLISHYNNQYDALYGFIRQYMMSGNSKWYELLSTLARHIVDIDIYNTVEDRDEYNGGLFWHTHHYLNAFNCTHRTFSAKHADDFIYGEIGGGPGAEHCYTTGLSYYYFMTGDEVFKKSALKLVSWMTNTFEGSGTVIERLLQFKNRDIPILKSLMAGNLEQNYKYPFTRGTGNYITALIDAYNLTGDHQYLGKVENVIKQSVHPLDDISLRKLNQIETGWSYLIFLQAICKYLEIKINNDEIDDACIYAKDSLLHYADWMVEYESPFLDKADQLEYANHTWIAQDLRKANILYIAASYNEERKKVYVEKACYLVNYVSNELSKEETRYFSRILIILMQNDIAEPHLAPGILYRINNYQPLMSYNKAPMYRKRNILFCAVKEIVARLFHISIKDEKRWLSFRMNRR